MANPLGPANVDQVARLARLRLDSEETGRLAAELARILAYADQVRQVNTDGIPPMSHPFADDTDHTREDRVQPSLPRDEALAEAPAADHDAGFFKVPRVIG